MKHFQKSMYYYIHCIMFSTGEREGEGVGEGGVKMKVEEVRTKEKGEEEHTVFAKNIIERAK